MFHLRKISFFSIITITYLQLVMCNPTPSVAKVSPISYIDTPSASVYEATRPPNGGVLPLTTLTQTHKVKAPQAVFAFPGAEGFGAQAVGGRGGVVIEVTNLDDSGPGSLRAAVETAGARTVVFRVAGTISLKSPLEITNPYITIAGQTAPGSGITIRNEPSNQNASFIIETNDVIIRYLRIRPGPSSTKSSNVDAMTIQTGFNIIIDHVSMSWATDEVLSTWLDPHDVTIQWSIISEGLECSTHPEGCHSKGLLLGSEGSKRISIHHNLMAQNKQRNPLIKTSGLVDVVNNIIYNPTWAGSVVADDFAQAKVNYVSNYLKKGPDSLKDDLIAANEKTGKGFALYASGNISPRQGSANLDDTLAFDNDAVQYKIDTRHAAPTITTESASDAYESVLNGAGATLPLRDEVDARIVADVRAGTGGLIDDPSEVGGWPIMRNGPYPVDTDHDGMPDSWENQQGLNPNDPSDRNGDLDQDGYTNLEAYLNQINITEAEIIFYEAEVYLPLALKLNVW